MAAASEPPLQAYAKLQGEDFVYYVQTLNVVLGRRVQGYDDVHVDLGPSRTISRRHCSIDYNVIERQFLLTVLGKNGVWVNGEYVSSESDPVSLDSRTAIQVGDVCFYFLLPTGAVSRNMPPAPVAPQLRLSSFWSREPSPTDTLSRATSRATSRTTSRAESPDLEGVSELGESGDEDVFDSNDNDSVSASSSLGMQVDPPGARSRRRRRPSSLSHPDEESQVNGGLASPDPQGVEAEAAAKHLAEMHKRGKKEAPATGPVNVGSIAVAPIDTSGQDPHKKPPFSYAVLIAEAITSVPEKKMTLSCIYKFISSHYLYYQNANPSGWQNSIRHNLSLNKSFVRVLRGPDEPGKGAFWTIDPESAHLFVGGKYKKRPRGKRAKGGATKRSPADKKRSSRRKKEAAPYPLQAEEGDASTAAPALALAGSQAGSAAELQPVL